MGARKEKQEFGGGHGLVSSQRENIVLFSSESSTETELAATLGGLGFSLDILSSGEQVLEKIRNNSADTLIIDLEHVGDSPGAFLEQLSELHARSSTIMLTEKQNLGKALECLRLGVADVLVKPTSADDICFSLRKARERGRLQHDHELLKGAVAKRYSFSNIIAKSPSMIEIFETLKKISDYKTTVLICGESGTGKELIARALHHNSIRKHRRFVAINCGAIPENLLESELFGHKRGAFTDATRDKKGLFEEAEGGTILLDEIGELPLHLQVKLLRVLQENEIRPVGESHPVPINVRIVAATLRDLEADILDGRFRDDLFYRLNVVTLRIPPLRERKEDIPVLVNYFIKKNQEKLGLGVYGIAKDALAALIEHQWPGNIRELENCLERSMILTEGEEISLESLPRSVKSAPVEDPKMDLGGDELSIKVHSRMLEQTLIRRALNKTKGNRTHAAKLLEVSHRTLLYKLKEYNLAEVDGE